MKKQFLKNGGIAIWWKSNAPQPNSKIFYFLELRGKWIAFPPPTAMLKFYPKKKKNQIWKARNVVVFVNTNAVIDSIFMTIRSCVYNILYSVHPTYLIRFWATPTCFRVLFLRLELFSLFVFTEVSPNIYIYRFPFKEKSFIKNSFNHNIFSRN